MQFLSFIYISDLNLKSKIKNFIKYIIFYQTELYLISNVQT